MSEPTPPPLPTLDVAIYGIINAGKSSLINALARRDARAAGPIGGTTAETAAEDYRTVEAVVGPYAIRLIDTPGLEEVDGRLHAAVATRAARDADLVLFVTAEDLTATALDAIVALHEIGKPLMVAVNKEDLLDPDEESSILAAIRAKLDGLVPAGHILATAAAPIVRRKVVEADGTSRVETVRDEPRIAALEATLLEAIAAAAPALKELAEASATVEGHLASSASERADRRGRAERVADETSAAWAMAMAVNPIPALDLLAGPGGLAVLVTRVAWVYDARLDRAAARELAAELFRGGRKALWGSLAGVGVGGLLKFIPGLGHVAGSLTQGLSAGLFGHIVGRALVDYFENGRDWGEGGLMATLDRIAARTDRHAVTRGLAATLRDRLRRRDRRPRGPHDRGAAEGTT